MAPLKTDANQKHFCSIKSISPSPGDPTCCQLQCTLGRILFFFVFLSEPVWRGWGLRCVMSGLPLLSLSTAICMWALTSIVLVGTADFIKFLTPQGYKSGYHCKCFKLFKLSRCSTLSPRLCTSHAQTTPSHTSLTAFTLLFSLILFLLHITPAISTGSSNSAALSRLRGGFSTIGLWSSQVFFLPLVLLIHFHHSFFH